MDSHTLPTVAPLFPVPTKQSAAGSRGHARARPDGIRAAGLGLATACALQSAWSND